MLSPGPSHARRRLVSQGGSAVAGLQTALAELAET
ncbi:hypothetical protein PI125_g1693 [Phytophthora idaei]|nr:hypothetical protein PI125_g1693 [Phytophthora idaei]